MTGTRPDIAYAVGFVSRTLENPIISDRIRVNRIFRYLQGTTNYGITYEPQYKHVCSESFSNADHGGDETTRRSTRGVVCLRYRGYVRDSHQLPYQRLELRLLLQAEYSSF
ncbi:hypothetical protein JTB14_007646 [Gonioctena quinquepunctata]|nr:hypothetical protein JTB14_007646 [Gonioctena quinquepunctata]